MNRGAPGGNRPAPAPNPDPGAASAGWTADSTKGEPASPIKNLADPNSPAPELWKIKPDPPEEQPASITQDVLLRVPPSFFGGEVTYPTAPSVFVAAGRNGDQNDVREFWDLAARKRVGALRGSVKLDRPFALSPDGTLFVGKNDKTFTVYETKTGKLVASLSVQSPFADFVDFAGPGQVVTGVSGDRRFEIWDLKTQKSELEVAPRDRVARESVVLSPGRKYMALIGASTLWVYDLQSGRRAGEAPVPKNNIFELSCKGLAFSSDGAELAGLFDSFGLHLLCWDVATGRLTHRFKYDDKSGIKMPPGFEGNPLDWLAVRAGWLLFGTMVIDHQSGQKTFTIPSDTPGSEKGPRKVVGKNLVLITVGEAQNRVVRGFPLPTETIAKAAKLIEQGGSAVDAALPPLKPADLSRARKIATAASAPAWSVQADGSRPSAALLRRSIPTQVPANEAIGLLLTGLEGHQIGLVSVPGGASVQDPNQNEGKPRRLVRFDSLSGRTLGRTELTGLSDLVALSPDGATVLTLDSRDRGRLDLYSTAGAGHVAGWRPYGKELSDNDKTVVWADFLTPDRVLTANRTGLVVLWSIPDCKAVYMAEGACEGAPVLSPGRRYLAAYLGGTFRFLDPATGDLKGEVQPPVSSSSGRAELKGAAFQPDGSGLVALVGSHQVVRWDLGTGKVTADFAVPMTISPGPSSHHAVIESCGPNHALLDGRILVDLEKRAHVWSYFGPNVSAGGPDGRHWFVGGANTQNVSVTPLALPEENVNRVVAMANDPAVKPSLRQGMEASVQLELSGPPRDNEGFRRALTDSLSAKLRANGITPGQVGPVSFIVHVEEKDTGRRVDYRQFGDSRFSSPRGAIALKDLFCDVQFADGQGRIPLAPQQRFGMLQGFRRIYRLPQGDTLESYLKNNQWNGLKIFVSGIGLPYFVARQADGVVMLPGTSDLNAVR
jgi:WD40 repeat protein